MSSPSNREFVSRVKVITIFHPNTNLAFWQISSSLSWYGDIRECLCATITDLQNPSANYRGAFLCVAQRL
ncbi:hypothetical protein [Aulosira sp. FACHB-615]|uniref:hypothetical protein n=1 Tax=Aulosira sp. FACHB-615 TaxID=2692777 RepID=UPI00168392A5|nr:hypothetical protein [Aulosira sp. FACHB-615]MBD2492330.1 hypothetical protein [Aulosira sp. FACHB-615]